MFTAREQMLQQHNLPFFEKIRNTVVAVLLNVMCTTFQFTYFLHEVSSQSTMIIGTSVRIVSEMGQFDITLVTSVVRSAFVCFLKQTLFFMPYQYYAIQQP